MILVSLGTQDREFTRLLKAVEKQIKLGNIKEKVIVQAGETKFESDCMEIFDLIPSQEFLKLLKECRVLITHGGVGTIIDGLHYHKKIIAAARLCEYGEHQNNHQQQIIQEFTKKHYILELKDFERLDEILKQLEHFEPKEYESNTKEFISNLESYIDHELENHRGDRFRRFMIYAFFGFWGILLQLACLSFLPYDFWSNVIVSYIVLIMYHYFMHFLFFKGKWSLIGEGLFFLFLGIQILFLFAFPNIFQLRSFIFMFLLFGISGLLEYVLSLLFSVQDV